MKLCNLYGLSLAAGLTVIAAALLMGCTAKQPQETRAAVTLVERGEELYNANCRSCHGGATGGQMMDIPPPHNANGHTWHHPDCQLEEIVLNGSGEMGEMMRRMMGASEETPRMPAFQGQLTEADVEAILAYIKTWWNEGQREMQAKITQAQCGVTVLLRASGR